MLAPGRVARVRLTTPPSVAAAWNAGITTTTCNLAPPSPSAFEDPEHQLQLRAKLLDRFRRERAARFRFELSRAAVLLDLLPRSLDCVFLGVKEVLYQHDELDFASLIHTVAGTVFRRIQEPELALPVPEHMRLEIGELAHFADGKELLDRLRPPSPAPPHPPRRPPPPPPPPAAPPCRQPAAHCHCSAFSSRSMRSATACLGGLLLNRM